MYMTLTQLICKYNLNSLATADVTYIHLKAALSILILLLKVYTISMNNMSMEIKCSFKGMPEERVKNV